MKEKYIYLVFTKTGTWFSKVLDFFEPSDYLHSSLSLNKNLDTLYSFGRRNPNNPFSGGFAVENLEDGVFSKNKNISLSIYKIYVTPKQYQLIDDMVNNFLINEDQYKYNMLGLLGFFINKPIKRENHYFCSQFVSELLITSNVVKLDKPASLTKPSDLIKIYHDNLVYKGHTGDFSKLKNSFI